jgi:hypothetical protein
MFGDGCGLGQLVKLDKLVGADPVGAGFGDGVERFEQAAQVGVGIRRTVWRQPFHELLVPGIGGQRWLGLR